MVLSRKYLILLPVSLLMGCGGAGNSRIYTADGKRGYAINCSGIDRNWGVCYQKAGSICEELGYDVLEVTGESGTVTDVDSNSKRSTAKTMTTHNRIMVIQCKQPEIAATSVRKIPEGN